MDFCKDQWQLQCPKHNRPRVARVCSDLAEAVIEHFIPIEEFYISLQTLGLRPRHIRDPPRIHLRDAKYDKIAKLLKLTGKSKWAYLPRTFVVLYQTGLEHHMDAFIKDNRTDFYLPYTEDNLPDALTGDDRLRFLHYQDNVLSDLEFHGPGKQLESGHAPHLHLRHSADNFFHHQRVLDQGGFAIVEHVIGKSSVRDFALKKMSRDHFFDNSKEKTKLHLFQNELTVLQSLKHRHIVKLVGSYTDNEYVGLLTWPVADMNLVRFLKGTPSPVDTDDRSIRLRSFFGCIATAIDYLHNNETTRVQHKDIKPANILVWGKTVLIADFGTARSRTDDSTDTTESTAANTFRFLTRKYAAPEAANGKRTFASDIWSLGCVFLEMLTVLAGRSIDELQRFFSNSGSESTIYHENQKAIDDWLLELDKTLEGSECPEDAQLTTIIRLMCDRDQTKRLDSRDLVRRIFKLDGPMPYHGLCCGRQSQLSGPTRSESMDSMSTHSSVSDSSLEELDPTHDENSWMPFQPQLESSFIQSSSTYISPVVEDSDTTIVAYNLPPKISRHVLEDVTEFFDDSRVGVPRAASPIKNGESVESASGQTAFEPVDVLRKPETTKTACKSNALGTPDQSKRPQNEPESQAARFGGTDGLACPYPGCKPPKGLALQLFDSHESLHEHLREMHLIHDIGRVCLSDGSRESSYHELTLSAESGAMEIITQRQRPNPEDKQVRFSELPKDSRPKPKHKAVTRARMNKGIYSINAEMPAAPGHADANTTAKCAQLGIPPATFTPSYLLAAKNRFSQLELLGQRTKFGKPLFVYGALMFPGVLRSQSDSFINTEGTYSSSQGHRLNTTSRDWNGMQESIQSTAECMTPAILPGYKRFRLPHYSLAYVQQVNTAEETPGFLIFGLSAEALACLDHLYEEKGPRNLFLERESKTREWSRTHLQRKTATVRLNVVGGEPAEIEAEVYVATDEKAHLREDAMDWDIDHFVRSRSFNALTNRLDGGKRIVEEESIADAIGTTMFLPGDDFVKKVLCGDQSGLLDMLQGDHDVDAPSVRYGTALQAAASKGNLEMMRTLIDHNSSVNASGGEYGSALIASVVEGNYDAMKLLLQNNSMLFTPGGKYISALYQAVDFDRLDMAHALLEKGAWLTKDYREVLDLAAERNNDEMYEELVRYDVLNVHRKDKTIRTHSPAGTDTVIKPLRDRSLATESYTSIGAVCFFEAARLHNQPGKWTGRKGVKILRAGFERGLDEGLLEKIRPHIHSFPTIQKFFADAVGESFNGRLKPVKHTDPIEESRDGGRRDRSRSRIKSIDVLD